MEKERLVQTAWEAREAAYAPYSGFAVGAALLGKSGRVYTGCNVESCAFGPTCCAERTALFKAVSEGEREFSAIAVAGGPMGRRDGGVTTPCGVCRQMLYEFDDGSMTVLMASGDGFCETTLAQLLPMGFGPKRLAPMVTAP
ncbi:MAG: cytidine deaminase [Oscillospiraceae bacterium]|nr:cytidine deaminase [Oscillospiraceae bacterium]